MTSREIAGLTGKQHAYVLRDVRNLLDALEIDQSSFGSKFNMNTLSNREPIRGNPLSLVINESRLYSLIRGSEQAEAKTFKRWVTSEVLPSIRRNGGYMTAEVAVMAVEGPAVFLARALSFDEYQSRFFYESTAE